MFAQFFSPPDGEHVFSDNVKLVTNRIRSFNCRLKFAGSGEFTMLLHFDTEMLKVLRLNDIIKYDKRYFIIKGIKYDESTGITLTGTDLNGILSQRLAFAGQVTGTTAQCIKYFLDQNMIFPQNMMSQNETQNETIRQRRIPMQFSANGITGLADDGYMVKSGEYQNLADVVDTLCDWAGIGYRINCSASLPVFDFNIIKGTDRSMNQSVMDRVIFSPDWGNVVQQSFEHDISNMYNAVYALDTDSNILLAAYRDNNNIPEGIERQEAFVEVSANSNTDNIRKFGLAQTESNVEAHNYTIVPTAEGFERDYYLGDIVTIRDKYIGNNFSAVITEVEKNYSDGRKSVKISVGTQKPKLLNMIINNMKSGVQKKR